MKKVRIFKDEWFFDNEFRPTELAVSATEELNAFLKNDKIIYIDIRYQLIKDLGVPVNSILLIYEEARLKEYRINAKGERVEVEFPW